jgi:hypothetical protein
MSHALPSDILPFVFINDTAQSGGDGLLVELLCQTLKTHGARVCFVSFANTFQHYYYIARKVVCLMFTAAL